MPVVTGIFDTSAILAIFNAELGSEHAMEGAAISTVNMAEIVTKLFEWKFSEHKMLEYLVILNIAIVPFDRDTALETGRMRGATRYLRLSLGDGACHRQEFGCSRANNRSNLAKA